MTDCAYIFLDESGNFDFSTSGTRYFMLTSVSLYRPFSMTDALDAYRHDCLEFDLDMESFHCANDNRYVRGRVFDLIAHHLDDIRVDCLVVEKRKASPPLRKGNTLYPWMLGRLLRFVVRKETERGIQKFIIITDRLPFTGKRNTAQGVVRRTLTRTLPGDTTLQTFHHASCSHYGLQLADYCCWAMFRKWERGEPTYRNRIGAAVRSEHDIFRTET